MKVLMQSRNNFFTLRGGDTIQLEKTKAELEKLGVEVDFSLDFNPDLSRNISSSKKRKRTREKGNFIYYFLAYG